MILLGHSYFLIHDAKQRAKMKPYAPLSTQLAAALLRRAGHQVSLFDATFASGIDAFETMLDQTGPSVVALMEDNFNFLTKMCTTVRRESAVAMIGAAHARGCKVAVNGPDSSDNPAPYLSAGADAIVQGEGETALLDLVEAWERADGDPRSVRGVILKEGGEPVSTGLRRGLQDLDALEHPAWDLLNIDAYRQAWRRAHGEFSWNMATSRGCPYACNWCAKPTFGRRYTVRSPQEVVREMVRLKSEISPDHIWFTDDIFGLNVEWTCAFAEEVQRRGVRIAFTMQSRVNLMTDRIVNALASAGAREVWLGVESGSQRILDAMDKGTTVEAARSATRTLKSHGVKACWFIQLGYPSETWEDLLATRDLIREECPDEIGVSVAYPLPGTDFYDRVRTQLGSQRNWKDSNDLAMLFQGAYDSSLYRLVRDILHCEVETGRPDDDPWIRLGARAHHHRSPHPFRLIAGARP